MPWVPAAGRAELATREVIGVACAGRRLALYRLDEDIFATSDACPHQGAPLSQGCVVSGHIECPLHFALFDIRTGASDGAMTTRSVQTYATKIEDDVIYVELPDAEENAQ